MDFGDDELEFVVGGKSGMAVNFQVPSTPLCVRVCVCAQVRSNDASSRTTTTLYSEPAAHDVHLHPPITRDHYLSVPDYC